MIMATCDLGICFFLQAFLAPHCTHIPLAFWGVSQGIALFTSGWDET